MTEIFNLMVKEGLTPNSFYVLYCIKEKIVPTNIVNKKLECKKLISQEWITTDLQLTNKSIIFTSTIDGYFKKSKKKTSKTLMGSNFMQNIDAYVKMDKSWDSDLAIYCEYLNDTPETDENPFEELIV